MLLAEYDYDIDIAVQREEAGRIAFSKEISQGAYQKALDTAKLMKGMNYPIGDICTISDLTIEEVENL